MPDLDEEGQLLLAALRDAGLAAEAAVWDEPTIDWGSYERVLLRSTWDYPLKESGFRGWLRGCGARLINPLPLVEWNLSKRYLEQLERWGFPVVPTSFTRPGETPAFPASGEFVVKPAVSAGSRDTARYRQGETGRAGRHASTLLDAGREVMVQPYLATVDREAETAIVVLGGEVSHAMRKAPLLELDQPLEQGLFRPERMELREPGPDERELASELIARLDREIGSGLYARVDLLRSERGEPLVLELELIEPSLFLDHHPPAVARLVELVVAELER